MTFNVVNSRGFSIPKPNRANQVSSFNTNMKPQKNRICFSTFLANFTSLSYFEKIAHLSVWSECMYLCGYVCVMMSVAGANKVESTMILMLGTNEILRLNHDIAKSQTRAL